MLRRPTNSTPTDTLFPYPAPFLSDHRLDVPIAFGRRIAADPHRLVGRVDMHGARVGIRMHRNDMHAHAMRRARDAHRDLAAVRDQQAPKHATSLPRDRKSTRLNSSH